VAGRYVPARPGASPLLGSANQRLHFLSDRYDASDLEGIAEAEVIIDARGRISLSGIAPPA